MLDKPGVLDGTVSWTSRDGAPAASMRLRVITLPPIRLVPGGAVFNEATGPESMTIRVVSCAPAAPPAAVRVDRPVPGLVVRVHGDTIAVHLEPSAERPTAGSCGAEVIGPDGGVLTTFPIVWWHQS